MKIILVTGSCGLIGSESVEYFSSKFDLILGIDNDMRSSFFGKPASINWNKKRLIKKYSHYSHYDIDIRDYDNLMQIFKKYNSDIKLIIHAAAQPSHDWASKNPQVDFSINANGTLNLLEGLRKYCDMATFIFTSTNKVYGDRPNSLPFIEKDSRFEVKSTHPYYLNGIDESMSIDQSKHSLFGVSKASADLMVQEYGRYYGLNTGVFRGGCLTGPMHSGAELHGFLSYLIYCALSKRKYFIYGYKGKQVRDNIHSQDLIKVFDCFYTSPNKGEVYNVGGGRFSNCSIIEVFKLVDLILNKKILSEYVDENRLGDHQWWISDMEKFKSHYPNWDYEISLNNIIKQIGISVDKRLSK